MKILIFDIETSPHVSMHWGRWNENIQPEKTLAESHMICFAAKWHHSPQVIFRSEWDHGFDEMIKKMWKLLDEADAVVGFNSNKFDIKKVNTEFVRLGYGPPSPYHSIDLYAQAKKHFAFSSNRLKHLLKELSLSPKLEENSNIELWKEVCIDKKRSAQRRMQAYNIQDVKSTEEFYDYLLGWITPHPNWGLYVDDVSQKNPICPNCGGHNLHKHKIRTTKVRKYRQYRCADCGSYHRGRKNIGPKGTNNGVLS